jgi:hypothetical protein
MTTPLATIEATNPLILGPLLMAQFAANLERFSSGFANPCLVDPLTLLSQTGITRNYTVRYTNDPKGMIYLQSVIFNGTEDAMLVQLVTNRVVKFVDPFHSTEYYSIFQAQKVVNVLLPSGRIWSARLNDIDTNAIVPSKNVIAY